MKIDIHSYARQAQLAFKRVTESNLSDRNKEILDEFLNYLIANGYSNPRVCRYADVLRYWGKWLDKDFDIITRKNIEPVVRDLQLRQDYSVNTKQIYKVMLKVFFRWLKKVDEYPEEVKWISIRISKSERTLPVSSEMITESDMEKILPIIDNPRDKAFVSMLWESGCRIGELSSLCLRNIEIDKYGILATVHGKTGQRKIRLVSSTQYLMTWINMHPLRHDKQNALWVNQGNVNKGKPLQYRNIALMIRKYFTQAGIRKKCNPHFFRHSRATYMANHLTEFQMNQYFGWSQGSDMPSTYVHLSGRDIDNAILSINGVQAKDTKEEEVKLKPKVCSRCQCINSYESKYCQQCAGILDIKEALRLEQERKEDRLVNQDSNMLMKFFMENPDLQRMFAQKMAQMTQGHMQPVQKSFF